MTQPAKTIVTRRGFLRVGALAAAAPVLAGAPFALAQSPARVTKVLDFQTSLNGRRLCENTVGLLEEKGLANWTSAGAVDKTEWVNQLRTTSTIFGPYQVQESVHANYWGQLAMRNCMRQAYNAGTPRGGNCLRTANGLNASGEPNMTLQ